MKLAIISILSLLVATGCTITATPGHVSAGPTYRAPQRTVYAPPPYYRTCWYDAYGRYICR